MIDGSRPVGLTVEAARARRAADGPNELPRAGQRPICRIALGVVVEPMLVLLLADGIRYLLLGDLTEALILLAFASCSIAVMVIQESRTEHVLESLRDLSAPHALVVRDGIRIRIAGREMVVGNLIVLEQGDRIAADAVLVEASDLQTDESVLTGESLPVSKTVGAVLASAAKPSDPMEVALHGAQLAERLTTVTVFPRIMPEQKLRIVQAFTADGEIVAAHVTIPGLILVNRPFSASLGEALIRQNAALRDVALAITGVTALILFLPQAQVLLKFGSIAWSYMALAVGLGILVLVSLEGHRPLVRRLPARGLPIAGRELIIAP